jgi:hypothetical protein
MGDDEGGLVRRIAQLALDPGELGLAEHAGSFVYEVEGVEQEPVHLGTGDGGDVFVWHIHDPLGVGRRRSDDGVEEVGAVVVVAEGAVNLDGLLPQRLDAAQKRDVVLADAFQIGAIAVHNEAEGLLADFEHLIGAAAQVFRHANATRVERFICSDVGV